jgi:5-methylcytosine-specific restriction endonuclease McrA
MEQRRNYRRRRRSKNLRYRKKRFLNRKNKEQGWLSPSIQHRVDQVVNFAKKIQKLAPVTGLALELVRKGTQAMDNPDTQGAEYQQGTLAGYEGSEYLLEKWGRRCAYCGAENVPLQVEHIVPRIKGGSNRVSNLTLACAKCNQKKDSQDLTEFLKNKPEQIRKIQAQAKAPLKGAAAVNSSRWALWNALKEFGLPLRTGSYGQAKYNRSQFNIPKTHALDAACVGPLSGVADWTKPILTIISLRPGKFKRTTFTAHLLLQRLSHAFQDSHPGFRQGISLKRWFPKVSTQVPMSGG